MLGGRETEYKELSSGEGLLWPVDQEASQRLSNTNNPGLKGMGLLKSVQRDDGKRQSYVAFQTKLPRAQEYLNSSLCPVGCMSGRRQGSLYLFK